MHLHRRIPVAQTGGYGKEHLQCHSVTLKSNDNERGTTYRWKTAPNTSQAGNTTGIVSVTVPDREEAFEVTVPIEVFLADADKIYSADNVDY